MIGPKRDMCKYPYLLSIDFAHEDSIGSEISFVDRALADVAVVAVLFKVA